MSVMMKRYGFFFLCGALVVLIFAIRRIYGADVAKEFLPYFIAAPCAYVLVTIIGVISRLQRQAKTARARADNLYLGGVLAAMVLLAGTQSFQPWLNPQLWVILGLVVLMILVVVVQLLRNRLSHGTWLVKRPPTKP